MNPVPSLPAEAPAYDGKWSKEELKPKCEPS